MDSVGYVDQAVNLNSVLNYLQDGQATLKAQSDARKSDFQGPDGLVASKTVQSVELLLDSVKQMKEVIHNVNTAYVEHTDVSSRLTLVCKQLFMQ